MGPILNAAMRTRYSVIVGYMDHWEGRHPATHLKQSYTYAHFPHPVILSYRLD